MNTDITGRTNGAGTHTWIAGKRYLWTINDQGRLEAIADPPDDPPKLPHFTISRLPDWMINAAIARSTP